jgi:hypothetical protein
MGWPKGWNTSFPNALIIRIWGWYRLSCNENGLNGQPRALKSRPCFYVLVRNHFTNNWYSSSVCAYLLLSTGCLDVFWVQCRTAVRRNKLFSQTSPCFRAEYVVCVRNSVCNLSYSKNQLYIIYHSTSNKNGHLPGDKSCSLLPV